MIVALMRFGHFIKSGMFSHLFQCLHWRALDTPNNSRVDFSMMFFLGNATPE